MSGDPIVLARIVQKLANYSLWAKAYQPFIFVNKALLDTAMPICHIFSVTVFVL